MMQYYTHTVYENYAYKANFLIRDMQFAQSALLALVLLQKESIWNI